MANRPTNLFNHHHENDRANSNSGMAAPGSSNDYVDHSWQTERTYNLDDFGDQFDILEYIGKDSTTPLEEYAQDEIEQQKMGIMYQQMQFNEMMTDEFQQQNDFDQSADFASVPNFTDADMMMNSAEQRREASTPANTYAQFQNMAADNHGAMVPSTSRASVQLPVRGFVAIKPEMIVKEEPQEHVSVNDNDASVQNDKKQQIINAVQEEFSGLSLTGVGSSSSRASSVISSIGRAGTSTHSSAKKPPRKYRIKPESEKQNPLYKQKRQKNNDAVRRSRDKAKQQQMIKEMHMHELEQRVQEDAAQISRLERQVSELQNENQRLRQNCRCGSIGGAGNAIGKHRR